MGGFKSEVEWYDANGSKFRFEFKLHYSGISSVKSVIGKIYVTQEGGEDRTSGQSSKKRKIATEVEVGYLSGYLIKRNNKNFHKAGDEASQELHEFTVSLYDSDGRTCRVPNSDFSKTTASKGGMLLIEKIEHKNLRGIDLGINFLHELLCTSAVKKEAGVIVMEPTTLSKSGLQYKINRDKMNESLKDKTESESIDITRQDTVKLRRQFSRMGFAVIQDSPAFVDMWFLSMDRYKSMTSGVDIKSTWLSKEQAMQLCIPMSIKKHVTSKEDDTLKEILSSIFPSPDGFVMNRMLTSQSSESLLTNTVKAEMRRLINAGASLSGINALHMAAANYKSVDLFIYLIKELGMDVDRFDEKGNLPIHVAACAKNIESLQALLALGSKRNATNRDGLTSIELLEREERCMEDFRKCFGITRNTPTNPTIQNIKALLSS